MGLLCSLPPPLSCLHLLTFGRLSSAKARNVRKHLPVLPPLLATPARLPRLLQAARQSGFASSEDSDPTTAASGGRAVFCRARAARGMFALAACGSLAGFPGSSDLLRELLVWKHVVFSPGLAAACQPLYKHSPVSHAPLCLFCLSSALLFAGPHLSWVNRS